MIFYLKRAVWIFVCLITANLCWAAQPPILYIPPTGKSCPKSFLKSLNEKYAEITGSETNIVCENLYSNSLFSRVASYFVSYNKQTDKLWRKINNSILTEHDKFDVVAVGEGGVIVRMLMTRCDLGLNVRRVVTIDSPISGFTYPRSCKNGDSNYCLNMKKIYEYLVPKTQSFWARSSLYRSDSSDYPKSEIFVELEKYLTTERLVNVKINSYKPENMTYLSWSEDYEGAQNVAHGWYFVRVEEQEHLYCPINDIEKDPPSRLIEIYTNTIKGKRNQWSFKSFCESVFSVFVGREVTCEATKEDKITEKLMRWNII